MLIELQGGATIIRTSMINEVWVDWGNKIKAKISGEEDSIYLAAYYDHPDKTAAVFKTVEKAMTQPPESSDLLILPDDDEKSICTWIKSREEADNDNSDVH